MASANDLSSRGWNLRVAAEAPPSGPPFAAVVVRGEEEEGPLLFRARCGGGDAGGVLPPAVFSTTSSTTRPAGAAFAPGGPLPSPIVSVGGDRGRGAPEPTDASFLSMMPPTTISVVGRADWMESLTQACLDRARQFKKKRRRCQQAQQQALHGGETSLQLGALTGVTSARSSDREAEGNDKYDRAAGAIHEMASKRRRRSSHPDEEEIKGRYGRDPSSLLLAARRTIQDALLEQQQGPDGVGPIQHRGANGGGRGPGPQQQSQFAMTNEEWLDLLRQVQEELCDADGASVDSYHPLDEHNNSDDDERIERAVEAARAEQAYWDERAAEWLVEGEGEGGGGGEPGDGWGRQFEPKVNGPAAFEHEYVEDDDDDDDDGSTQILCPVCREARLTFVASEGDDAAGGTVPRGSLGSLVCPNHLDGSCTMRVDRVPPPRRKALTAMQRLLCELSELHAFSAAVASSSALSGCPRPPEFEVLTNDQVLRASCAACGWTTSVPLASSWFSAESF